MGADKGEVGVGKLELSVVGVDLVDEQRDGFAGGVGADRPARYVKGFCGWHAENY